VRAKRAALPLCLALALGCAPAASSLSIQIVSDMLPGVEVDELRVVVTGPSGDTVVSSERPIATTDELARAIRVAELASPVEGSYRIELTLLRQGGEVQHREARARTPRDHVVTILVSRDCNGVTCPAPSGDPSAAACLGGRCVDPECSEEHPELCGPPACEGTTCAASTNECLETQCTASGVCVALPIDGACPGGTCDPVVGCMNDHLPAPHVLTPTNGDRFDPSGAGVVAEAVPGALYYRTDSRETCPDFPACETAPGSTPFQSPSPMVNGGVGVGTAPPVRRRSYFRMGACDADGCHYSPFRYYDVHAPRGDYDGDGDSDLAATAGPNLVVVPGGPSFDLGNAYTVPVAIPTPLVMAEVGDVDADGFADLAVATQDGTTVQLFFGGLTGLDSVNSISIPTDGVNIASLARAGDSNADGFADFAAIATSAPAVLFYLGNAERALIANSVPLGAAPIGDASAADLDRDGTTELVVATLGTVIAVQWTGTSFMPVEIFTDDAAATQAMTVEVGFDSNGDWYPELGIGDELRGDLRRVRVYAGPFTSPPVGSTELFRADDGESFGRLLTTCGQDALLVGQPDADDVGSGVVDAGWWACIRDVPGIVETAQYGLAPGAHLGTALSCLDLDGDGVRDLAVSGPGAGAGGSLDIYYGISHCAYTSRDELAWPTAGDAFGTVLAR
jgi:hypothetical protein